jgi:hypothetical protein
MDTMDLPVRAGSNISGEESSGSSGKLPCARCVCQSHDADGSANRGPRPQVPEDDERRTAAAQDERLQCYQRSAPAACPQQCRAERPQQGAARSAGAPTGLFQAEVGCVRMAMLDVDGC